MANYVGKRLRACPVQSASGEPNSACAGIARALSGIAGGPMQRNPASNNPLWRSLVGCLVAYALIINALLSGVVGAEWVAQAAAGLLGEHCPTDARAAAPAPAGQADDSSHCAFCTLAAPPVVLPADPPSARIILPCAGAPSAASDGGLILWPGHPGQLPRGPPQRS
jgi:hypothetical protein